MIKLKMTKIDKIIEQSKKDIINYSETTNNKRNIEGYIKGILDTIYNYEEYNKYKQIEIEICKYADEEFDIFII